MRYWNQRSHNLSTPWVFFFFVQNVIQNLTKSLLGYICYVEIRSLTEIVYVTVNQVSCAYPNFPDTSPRDMSYVVGTLPTCGKVSPFSLSSRRRAYTANWGCSVFIVFLWNKTNKRTLRLTDLLIYEKRKGIFFWWTCYQRLM